ncbi:hypothetical protein I79_020819 [Cricetulus griseus]|uniref:Uncharacterized protein n=1 Tax=Cricetulus griseus TaxID=10029 RepID=G3IB31_CRIGR|nr:hypothetical protein I79_020819 [Cricetulus griseus]
MADSTHQGGMHAIAHRQEDGLSGDFLTDTPPAGGVTLSCLHVFSLKAGAKQSLLQQVS